MNAERILFEMESQKNKLTEYVGSQKWAIVIALGGLAFDYFTLEKIEAWTSIVQLSIFNFFAIGILLFNLLDQHLKFQIRGFWVHLWYYKDFAYQFFTSSLLSANIIFFSSSSDTLEHFGVGISLFSLYLFNELADSKKIKFLLRWFVSFLNLSCFLLFITPLITTRISYINYFLFISMNFVLMAIVIRFLKKKNIQTSAIVKVAVSSLAAPLLILGLGPLAKVLPAFPLSLKDAKAYYKVERTSGGFQVEAKTTSLIENLFRQKIVLEKSDPIYLFFKVISPIGIDDKILVDWYHEGVKQDSIPIRLIGGRKEGFRAYTFKNHHQSGYWKAVVRTSGGLVIGAHSFQLVYGSKPETQWLNKN